MEISPEGTAGRSSAKRAGAKPKVTVKPAASKVAVEKKPRAPRKTLTTKLAAAPEAPVVSAEPISEDVGGMIATAAYYLAAARNFTPGRELDDWLEAERNIRARLYG